MHITHLNTFLSGGAAIAARRLHDSLIKYGIDSKFYYLRGESPNNSYINLQEKRKYRLLLKVFYKIKQRLYKQKLNYYLEGRPEGYELFSYAQLFYQTSFSMLEANPNILHLHWVSDLIDYSSFFVSIPKSLPIVWTLHDMNPFTGGCHYAQECDRYKTRCCYCPQINNNSNVDLSAKSFSIKEKYLKNKNLHIVADSYWLENEAKASVIFSGAKSFQTIHYGLDTNIFKPTAKRHCKSLLGIDPEKTVITFGAEDIKTKRKGVHELLKALASISEGENLVFLSFGRGNLNIEIPHLTFKHFGFVESSNLLSTIYSASDLFIIPSLYEAFGQTALEAMACGTPIVGFDTGGIPDMVHPGKTGLLAKPQDSKDLAKQIQWMINHPDERRQMGMNARQFVEQEYTLEIQAEKYIDLYKKILG